MHAKPGHFSDITKIQDRTWAEAAAAPAFSWDDPQWQVAYNNIECCDLTPGRDQVDWSKCRRVDLMAPGPNFTAEFEATCGAPCGEKKARLAALAARREAAAAAKAEAAAEAAAASTAVGKEGAVAASEEPASGAAGAAAPAPNGPAEQKEGLLAFCPVCSE